MSLAPGTQLGSYAITGLLGAGGMGEVYRARDTKLGREVAIKTLPTTLAADKERLARFEREAKLLASLNHAHIGAIYGLDEQGGTLFIAMELIEGQSLEEKLKAGALPVEEALRLGLQIAEALEAAHAKGVVHRDLKPANVLVTPDGVAKVLDFGLAKAFSGDPAEATAAHSPALSLAMTQQGLVLGTAGYMSPEQASGQATDQRADVWAFGVVLYEMLTGLPLFGGETVPHILADVLRSQPDWSRLPKHLHPRIRQLLERCLEKRPRNRYAGIADARADIEAVLKDPRGALVAPRSEASVASRTAMLPWVAAAAVVASLLTWLGSTLLETAPAPAPVNRFTYTLPEEVDLFPTDFSSVMALSPDGRHFVFRGGATSGLYLREMGSLDARPIAGTASGSAYVFISPDGQSVAYIRPGVEIASIPISGGAPVKVADIGTIGTFGLASWGMDRNILYGAAGGIYRVPATGGDPTLLIEGGQGEVLSGPVLLPDGDTLLFSVTEGTDWDSGQIVVQSLATGERKVLVSGGNDARYLPTGHIVYAYGDGLFGIAFDLETLSVSGSRVPLLQGVTRANRTAAANFAVAEDGTLIYLTGAVTAEEAALVWVSRDGTETPINAERRAYAYAEISPDGTRLALDIRDEEQDTWVFDLERENLQRLSFDPDINRGAVWSPDGERVAFSRNVDGVAEVYWQAWDGSGTPESLTRGSTEDMLPVSFTPDGSALIYSDVNSPRDLWIVPIDGSAAEGARLTTTEDVDEQSASLSPDGRWLAYQSDESGSDEIYVRPFPDLEAGRWQISTDGGERPQWRGDSGELFYLDRSRPQTRVMAVAIETETGFRAGTPALLFEGDYLLPQSGANVYDVSADGERFLMIKAADSGEAAEEPRFIIVQNWVEELKRLVPTQ